MSTLFDLPVTLSPRLQWMQRHFINVDHSPHCPEVPYMAVLPMEQHRFMELPTIMAEAWRLYEEEGRIGYGMTEQEALIDLIANSGIPHWNQP